MKKRKERRTEKGEASQLHLFQFILYHRPDMNVYEHFINGSIALSAFAWIFITPLHE